MSSTCFLGEPVNFRVHVRPEKNYPVDLYFLMDLSRTMHDDLGNLKSLAGNICEYIYKVFLKIQLFEMQSLISEAYMHMTVIHVP